MGLDNVRRAPDAKTFREQLVKQGLMEALFEQQGNRTRAMVRVEHMCGAQRATRSKLIRCIGLKRSALAVGMMNLVYDMRRLCYLEGVSVPAWTAP